MSTAIAAILTLFIAIPKVEQAYLDLGGPVFVTQSRLESRVRPVEIAQAATVQALDRLTIATLQSQLYQAQRDHTQNPSATTQQQMDYLRQQIDEAQARVRASTQTGIKNQ